MKRKVIYIFRFKNIVFFKYRNKFFTNSWNYTYTFIRNISCEFFWRIKYIESIGFITVTCYFSSELVITDSYRTCKSCIFKNSFFKFFCKIFFRRIIFYNTCNIKKSFIKSDIFNFISYFFYKSMNMIRFSCVFFFCYMEE